MRKKKLEAEIYQLFLGQDSKRAWKMFQERQPPTPITAPETWHAYARSLYDVPGQPPISAAFVQCPDHSGFFTIRTVSDVIDILHNGRA